MTTDTVQLPRFNESTLAATLVNYNLLPYARFDLTLEQFRTVQLHCSGSSFGTFTESLAWVMEHDAELVKEAEVKEEQGFGFVTSATSHYYTDGKNIIAYETTRGTIFVVGRDETGESYHVLLPVSRLHGFHNRILLLVQGGVTEAQLHLFENLHNLHNDDKIQALAYAKRKSLYDPILVPQGYEPQETYAELLVKREAAIAKRRRREEEEYGREWETEDDYLVD